MIGLLGVLSVVPFGIFQVSRINKADFGGNCGRAAMQEIKIRRIAQNYENSFYPPVGLRSTIQTTDNGIDYLYCNKPLIVDPLMLESNRVGQSDFDTDFESFPKGVGTRGLPRVSCEMRHPKDGNNFRKDTNSGRGQGTANEYKFLAQDIFTWSDEKNFAIPAKPLVHDPRPIGITDDTRGYTALQSKDNYTWLYMLTPNVRGLCTTLNNSLYASEMNDITGYDVDVVVFFDRKFDDASPAEFERLVDARRESGSYRGGSFTIEAENENDLDMTDTRWVLVMCPRSNSEPYFAKWYRVVSSGEFAKRLGDGDTQINSTLNNPYQRKLMLIGPEVPDSSNYNIILAKGVIHVYSSAVVK